MDQRTETVMGSVERRGYLFGPLERRGLIAGFRAGQLLVIALAGAATVMAAAGGHPIVALAVLVGGLAVAFLPVAGRPVEAWAPVVTGWALRMASGARRWTSDAPRLGHIEGEPPAPTLPAYLTGIRILSTTGPAGLPMGVIEERAPGWFRRGGLYTAVVQVRPQAFALCDTEEQARRLAGWGATLAGLAREGSPVRRIQWLERTAPADDGELTRAVRSALAVPETHPLAAGFLALVEAAGPATQTHEAYVAVQVSTRLARRLFAAAGGGTAGALDVLRREIGTVMGGLDGADVTIEGALTPRALAKVIRTAFDPGIRGRLAHRAAVDPARAGVAPTAAWPTATSEDWSSFRADGTRHAVYWIEEWPRTPVRPDFWSPLLLWTTCARTVSVTAEPLSPSKATRQVEKARTHDTADEELRSRIGFLSSARRRRQTEGTARREEELTDGHADCRFSGYIAVSAPDPATLAGACGEIEQLASQCLLQVTRLWGQQAETFAWTLPLARGLR
jgi:hypothetical protein